MKSDKKGNIGKRNEMKSVMIDEKMHDGEENKK